MRLALALDRAIGVLFPAWEARRALARLRAELARQRRVALHTYDAAEKSRNTADWDAKNKSANQAILGDYATLTARARAAVRDDWAAVSIVDGHVRHVVGTGITPRANARDPETGEAYDDFNRAADRLWYRWARNPKFCDVERRKTFVDVQALCIRELITVGQAFVVLVYEPRPEMVGLRLQMFEPEQLDTSRRKNAETGNEIVGGIEIDGYGAPVAYWFYTGKHPLEGWRPGRSERIPADRVLHLIRPERVRQVYGVTRLASVLRELWHTKMYSEYTLLRARFEACGGATIETDPNAPTFELGGLLGATSETDAQGNKEYRFEPNMVWELPPGKRVTFHAPQVPGGQYEPFVKSQIKKIAAGAGLDYPTVSRDFSGNTYSGQRQGLLETWAETDPEQRRLIDVVLRPVWEAFQTYAVLEGRIEPPPGWDDPDRRAAILEADWQPPAKEWIDPAKQAQAVKTQLEQRLTTRRDILNQLGRDWRETMAQLADEERLADELGLELPRVNKR